MDAPTKPDTQAPSENAALPPPPPPVQPQQPAGAAPTTPLPASSPPPPVKKKRFPFLGIGIFLVLLLIFVAGLLYVRQNLYKEIAKHSQADHEAMEMSGMPADEPMAMEHSLINMKALTIGSDTTFQPMEYKNEKGEIVGFDADLGREIAKEMGVSAAIKSITWDDIFTALDNKEIDVIISSVSITDERKQKYGFSEPYLNAGQVILTRKTTTAITKPADLTGKKVGAQVNTTSMQEAEKYDAVTTSYPDPDAAIVDLVNNKLDAVIADLPAAKGYTDKNPTLRIASDPFTSEYYGIVFRKDDAELQKHVNQILEDLQQKGVLADLKEKWLE